MAAKIRSDAQNITQRKNGMSAVVSPTHARLPSAAQSSASSHNCGQGRKRKRACASAEAAASVKKKERKTMRKQVKPENMEKKEKPKKKKKKKKKKDGSKEKRQEGAELPPLSTVCAVKRRHAEKTKKGQSPLLKISA